MISPACKRGTAAGALALFGLCGCSEKPREPSTQPPAVTLQPAPAHGASTGLRFTAPPEWIPETPSSPMRQAQYRLPRAEGDLEDAELVVFFFQGQGGPVQANIDRWIGQFTKADGSPAGDVAKLARKESHGIPLTIVDVSGTYTGSTGPMTAHASPKAKFRMLAAVAEAPGGPWFFKLTGPSRTVARWEASFQSFLDTIQ
jgi:hypothetical protein